MGRADSTALSEAITVMRARMTQRGLSDSVQKAWLFWARSLISQFPEQNPASIRVDDVRDFVDKLGRQHQINAAGRRQGLEAIYFLLSDVVGLSNEQLSGLIEPLQARQAPTILSPSEVQQVLDQLQGPHWLMASLVYGAGLRLMECVRLRIRDLKGNRIVVCDANGRPARETLLPERVREPIRVHLDELKMQHIREIADGFGTVQLPPGFRAPASTARAWVWQFVFPGPYISEPSPMSNGCHRCHVPEPEARQAIEQAARQSGIGKTVSANTLRNSFAAHLIRRGVAVCDVEKLLGIERPASVSGSQASEQTPRSVGVKRPPESAAVGF